MAEHGQQAGKLFVVATPIGNLEDLSPRAIAVLSAVSLIAAEDTRHSKRLLTHFGVGTSLTSLHEHNEAAVAESLVRRLVQGQDVALISDAGTPLISDPGYRLVRAARAAGIAVQCVPGPSALTAALSIAGLPTDRFRFEGFLPARTAARRQRLLGLADETVTLVFYESSHRILDTLADMATCLGVAREAVVARELTKVFESVYTGTLQQLARQLAENAGQQRGEFVVLVHGAAPAEDTLDAEARRTLTILQAELPLKQAAALAARITGVSKNRLYDLGLRIRDQSE